MLWLEEYGNNHVKITQKNLFILLVGSNLEQVLKLDRTLGLSPPNLSSSDFPPPFPPVLLISPFPAVSSSCLVSLS